MKLDTVSYAYRKSIRAIATIVFYWSCSRPRITLFVLNVRKQFIKTEGVISCAVLVNTASVMFVGVRIRLKENLIFVNPKHKDKRH